MVRSPPIALDFSLGHVGPRKPVQTGFLSVLPRAEVSEVPLWRQSMTFSFNILYHHVPLPEVICLFQIAF